MRIVKQFDCIVLKQEIRLFCSLEIAVPTKRMEEVMNKLKELRGVEGDSF